MKRILNIERMGVSLNRYKELQAFCRQYNEWQEKLADIRDLQGQGAGSPVQSGSTGNPTERAAMQAMELQSKIDAVDRALKITISEDVMIYLALKRNVTEGISFEQLSAPISKNSFKILKTSFFKNLDDICK